MQNLLNRFKEPSTYAALAALAVLLGVKPETAHAVASGAAVVVNAAAAVGITPESAVAALVAAPAAIFGAVAVFLPERKAK